MIKLILFLLLQQCYLFAFENNKNIHSINARTKREKPGDENSKIDGATKTKFSEPNDPLWKDMWYVNNKFYDSKKIDHNVIEAWNLGYTGRGVVVSVIDDGLEITHEDLADNYDPDASYDVIDNDEDPTPKDDVDHQGTRSAGVVAAIFNNSRCNVGVAYGAKIGGIRLLDDTYNDTIEAIALGYKPQHIDIYLANWGPTDDGKTLDGPGELAKEAILQGVNKGRNGKGSIYIWASGIGGKDDSCSADGYVNSIYTISISATTEDGRVPWYSESCSPTIATAFSGGSINDRMIATTHLHNSCTLKLSGTTAAASLAGGIIALTLEANPNLGWRDIQHIIVRTAKPDSLRAVDWQKNGVGRWFSHSYGYGLLDAGAMVRVARKWKNVPKALNCSNVYKQEDFIAIENGTSLNATLYTGGCSDNGQDNRVNFLEHVQAIIDVDTFTRGLIEIYLTSPKGTRSKLMSKRPKDTSSLGYINWEFMSVHFWGESSDGNWTLEINNADEENSKYSKAELSYSCLCPSASARG
uniref:P/Homo B domain-containing protein n=1 Tax=Meloidogyne incognita TaxID=6306 RepID=A0A914L1P7_MELIC